MWEEWLKNLATNHRFKTIGALSGLLFAILVMRYGVFWTLFIFLCVGLGYWIGKRLDEGIEHMPSDLTDWVERFLAKGNRRL